MRAMDRLSEGDGDEPQPETPGASGAPVGGAGDPFRGNVRRRRSDAGTPAMRERMERARAARDPDFSKKHSWRRGLRKVEALLTAEHRAQYEELLRDPFITNVKARAWLKEHGYEDIGLRAIANHRQD